MMDAREDGELSGSDDNLRREAAAVARDVRPSLFAYRSSNRNTTLPSSDEDQSSDGDSDDNCHLKAPAKRRRKMTTQQQSYSSRPAFTDLQKIELQKELGEKNNSQATVAAVPALTEKKTKKRNDIWANVLGEQTLTENISGVGLKKLEGDRTVENYDFRAAQQLVQKQQQQQQEEEEEQNDFKDTLDGEMKEDGEIDEEHGEIDEEDEVVNRMTERLSRKRPMSSRVYRPQVPAAQPHCQPGEALHLPELQSRISHDELSAAIAAALHEQKPQLISGVVEVLGKETALKIYEETRRVEKEGGMIILNGERRRTSGGVYVQLVKKENLTKEQLATIFPPDEAQQQWRKRRRAVHRRKNRHENTDRQGTEGQSADSSSRLSEHSARLQCSDSNDATDLAGSKCPGSTPVTTPGPTPTTTPVVTPHCSDTEESASVATGKDKMAIVKPASPAQTPLTNYDEDFVDATVPPTDEMDVF